MFLIRTFVYILSPIYVSYVNFGFSKNVKGKKKREVKKIYIMEVHFNSDQTEGSYMFLDNCHLFPCLNLSSILDA